MSDASIHVHIYALVYLSSLVFIIIISILFLCHIRFQKGLEKQQRRKIVFGNPHTENEYKPTYICFFYRKKKCEIFWPILTDRGISVQFIVHNTESSFLFDTELFTSINFPIKFLTHYYVIRICIDILVKNQIWTVLFLFEPFSIRHKNHSNKRQHVVKFISKLSEPNQQKRCDQHTNTTHRPFLSSLCESVHFTFCALLRWAFSLYIIFLSVLFSCVWYTGYLHIHNVRKLTRWRHKSHTRAFTHTLTHKYTQARVVVVVIVIIVNLIASAIDFVLLEWI